MPRNAPHSEETKRKISLANSGRIFSKEHRRKLSVSHTQDVNKRFWSKVNIKGPDECWEWTGPLNAKGYGSFSFPGHTCRASRMAWILTYGNISKNICVLHKCDNPACCNPAHLYLGTNQDNVDDKVRKGRQLKGEKVGTSKLTEKQVLKISELYGKQYTLNQLATLFSVTNTTIWRIIHNYSWKHIPR